MLGMGVWRVSIGVEYYVGHGCGEKEYADGLIKTDAIAVPRAEIIQIHVHRPRPRFYHRTN
jgi:hypothetical protein